MIVDFSIPPLSNPEYLTIQQIQSTLFTNLIYYKFFDRMRIESTPNTDTIQIVGIIRKSTFCVFLFNFIFSFFGFNNGLLYNLKIPTEKTRSRNEQKR